MKLFKQIAISLILTISIFSGVLYISCIKDACKGITCLNGGACSSGMCNCKSGIGGMNCQTIYRNLYGYTYHGLVNATGNLDSLHMVDSSISNNALVFTAGTDTADYNAMQLAWNDNAGNLIVNMPITLKNNSSAGSVCTVTTINSDTFTYSGSGSVSTVSASLNLTRRHPHGASTVVFALNNFSRQ